MREICVGRLFEREKERGREREREKERGYILLGAEMGER